jgi:hypothetical protein
MGDQADEQVKDPEEERAGDPYDRWKWDKKEGQHG